MTAMNMIIVFIAFCIYCVGLVGIHVAGCIATNTFQI